MMASAYKLFFLLNDFDWVRNDSFAQYNIHLDCLFSPRSERLLQVNPPGREVLRILQLDISDPQVGLVAAANLKR